MAKFNAEVTQWQLVALAILPKFSSILSVFGSGFIILEILRSGAKSKLRIAYHRILLGMSTCDFIASTSFFLTTWPVPSGSPWVYGAVGNQQTCTAQGFFLQIGVGTILYNGALALYYLLVVKYGWTERQIRKVEPFMHFISLGWALGTSFAGLVLKLFNNSLFNCWISNTPGACKESWKNNGVTTCERGDNASLYQWIFYYIPVWTMMVFITISMAMVYFAVRDQENIVMRFQRRLGNDDSSEQKRKRRGRGGKQSKRVATQGMWYVGTVYATFTFASIARVTQWVTGLVFYPLLLLLAVTLPVQGFFNCVVYLRPRYMRYHKNNPELSVFELLAQTLGTTLNIRKKRGDEDERFNTDVEENQELPNAQTRVLSRSSDNQGSPSTSEEMVDTDAQQQGISA